MLLFFADDTLIFGEGTIAEAQSLKEGISLYERVSGQLINYEKSGIVFSRGMPAETIATITTVLGMQHTDSHSKYLGLPSIIGRNKREVFPVFKDRIWQRINS